MIVIIFQANTGGDFGIDAERAGLAHAEDSYDYSGVFLCDNKNDAEDVLLNLVHSLVNADNYIWLWALRSFGEALNLLLDYDIGSLKNGWSAFLSGNYSGTHLFMQEYDPKPDMDRMPLL